MRNILLVRLTALLLVSAASCRHIEQYADNPRGNFEALWTTLDEHYCFFTAKGIDWQAVHDEYAGRISEQMTSEELFIVCADMLARLQDGHVNLIAPFETSYYRKWWSDYPQNYDARLVEQYYFNFNYRQMGGITYGIIQPNIGYVRYPSFAYPVGDGNLDYVLGYLATTDGLIIDIRDNGGGDMTNVETIARRFIDRRTLAGYISHKAGPAHDDFAQPYAYYYDPVSDKHISWGKPVVVLVNRSTYSAANNFASFMSSLPQVHIVGATTGGGSGMPFSSELPNGWGVRFSGSPVYDSQGRLTEWGVEPSEGCAVDLDPEATLAGHDTMLDFAIAILSGGSADDSDE